MKYYVHKEKTEIIHTLTEIECDLCHKKVNQTKLYCDEWAEQEGDIKETIIKISEGISYREDGGYVREKWIDICPECFNNKLIPWLENQGVKIQTKIIYW